MPTVAGKIDLVGIAKSCGYPNAVSVSSFEELDIVLINARNKDELVLIEVKCSIGCRSNLGRPTVSPAENIRSFMGYLAELDECNVL